MAAAVVTQLAFALLWAAVGSLVTVIVQMVRRDRVEAAREDARVVKEFGPTLARWRPAMDAAKHLRPMWLPAAGRSGIARLRSAAARLAARLRPAATPAAKPAAPPAWVPADHTARDVNAFTWPTNPAPQPAPTPAPAPVGRVPVKLDFDPMAEDFGAWVRGTNARLHHEATQRVADPDATCLIPVQSGVSS